MRIIPDFGRLGIGYLVRDHLDTLYEIDKKDQQKKSYSDYIIFFAFPFIAFLVTLIMGWKFKGIDELMGGVAILTGLLFGLLIHIFSLALRVFDNERFSKTSRVTILIDELRSNVSYSCGVGLALTSVLVCCAAFDAGTSGTPPWVSGVIAALFMHLILTLLMVVKRVRTAYKLLTQ
ncbi:hypothetical protein AB0M44_47150 [Streptosporangium subroseum]|uniref:hypothetical protein n=1 Tax=Streptosporangium subroseum TaxID=106412 RepID=UPI00343CF983